MVVAKLKIDEVVDVDQIIKKVVKERKGVDLDTFFKRKIVAEDKEIHVYSFECAWVKNSLKSEAIGFSIAYVPITTCATYTILSSVKKDSVAIDVIFPSDDNRSEQPSNSIIEGLKKEGFKVVKYTGYNNFYN